MNGGVIFLVVLIFLVGGGYGGWFLYARWNAKRNGLPPPSPNPIAAFRSRSGAASSYPGPAPGGVKGFINTQRRKFKGKNNRSAAGAYEESSYESGGGGQPRGRGAGSRLDPDEAWSSRVGDEAYYEEQELGLHDHHSQPANPYGSSSYGDTSYGGGAGAPMPAAETGRGRSRTRESYDEHYDSRSANSNPFGDEHAQSLRGVSPRPDDTSYHGGATVQMPSAPTHKKAASIRSPDSPGDSRKSAFREDMS